MRYNNEAHLRNADDKLALPLQKKSGFSYNGARVRNSLPNEIRNCEALPMFYDKLISTYRPKMSYNNPDLG